MSSTTPANAKQERRDAAREKARKIREAQQRREKRNRILIIAGVVAFVAVVVVALYSILSQSDPQLDEVDSAPSTALATGGIPVGASGAAGSENEDVPVVDIYLDYQCHWCAVFEQTNAEALDTLATSGEATIVYHPIAILDGSDTGFPMRAAQAAAVVADQAPEQFTAFNVAVFAAQGPEGGVPLSDEQIAEAALSAGVPQEVVDSFGGDAFRDWVKASTAQATEDGVSGTPTIRIDGEDMGGDWQQPGALETAVAEAAGA
ncbi:DsbA family protein [Georgenia faecalis]|uniref:DsbA family protein n=1 Tax=Georgenia faecalis TaxID=2483799 RepID=A0ABV9D5Y3_9MICO|nr:thioredoxin domain-containing protein [Georgenia faecalis]